MTKRIIWSSRPRISCPTPSSLIAPHFCWPERCDTRYGKRSAMVFGGFLPFPCPSDHFDSLATSDATDFPSNIEMGAQHSKHVTPSLERYKGVPKVTAKITQNTLNMPDSTPPKQPLYSEAEASANRRLRGMPFAAQVLGLAGPPLPQNPVDAWRHQLINGHMRYALPGDWGNVRDDVANHHRAGPQR